MKNMKYQVAILGCGVIAKYHAQAVKNNKDLMDLYAVCDIIENKVNEFAEKFNVEKRYTDHIKMFKDEQIDIVCICTPSGVHSEQVVNCAKYGKHVLCEKPLDISKEGLDKMINAYKNTDLKIGSVFQYRTFSGNVEAKNIIEKGELGKVLIGNGYCKIFRSQQYYDSAGWRGTWEIDGGGCLMNQAIHTLDILSWLCGGVESVNAKTYTLSRDIEVEDSAFALLNFKNNIKGSFIATTLSNPSVGIQVEIICEKGRIVFNDPDTFLFQVDENGNETKLLLGRKDSEKVDTANNPAVLANYGHDFLIRDLAIAIKENKNVYVPLEVGRHVVDVILAIYESSKSNTEILLDI